MVNILAEMVMRKVLEGWNRGFNIGSLIVNNLTYADDIVLLAEPVEDLQTLVDRLVTEGRSYNLQINASKTKVMTNTGE